MEVEGLKKARNDSSKKIGEVVRAGGDAAAAREEVRRMGERIAALEDELAGVQTELQRAVERLPNLPHASVPEGAGDTQLEGELLGVAMPFRFRTQFGVLNFISTTTVFGTPVDVTLQELALETFFPADSATADVLRQLGVQATGTA